MRTLTGALLLPFPGCKMVATSLPPLGMSKVSSSLAFFLHVHHSSQVTQPNPSRLVREGR